MDVPVHVVQEKVTGSTLNGRKGYLKADVGDKDKWEFLNFADAWTPSEMVLPREGNTGDQNDDVFFTHVSQMREKNCSYADIIKKTVSTYMRMFNIAKVLI